jgi:hypothetical protein
VRTILGAPRRLREEEQQEGEGGARRTGDEEGSAPAVGLADQAADDVTEGGADRDRCVEDAEHARTPLGRITVRQERRRDDRVARLADADDGTGQQKPAVRRRQARRHRGDTPHEHARRDQAQAVAVVAEPAGRSAGQGVRDDEE